MSRYRCHECETEHGTDNVVAYCASCVHSLRKVSAQYAEDAVRLRVENESLKNWRDWTMALDGSAELEKMRKERDGNRMEWSAAKGAAISYRLRAEAAEAALAKAVDCPGCEKNCQRMVGEIIARKAAESRIKELESKVESEHELYLTAHRDNMKGADIIGKLQTEVAIFKQTTGDICPKCSWRTVMGEEGCLNCRLSALTKLVSQKDADSL